MEAWLAGMTIGGLVFCIGTFWRWKWREKNRKAKRELEVLIRLEKYLEDLKERGGIK